ncbi:hypothetical protein Nepgr_022739 [Nepenthes gracilis]|uniref:Uncharacterized protein n=1 Tax=Nepenthes gracilis TaxID=150966 RepID=A0AAD3T2M3_NEPGR|nr:hypothetical protein Nepgr_022739 [Nepenthes gracilis]
MAMCRGISDSSARPRTREARPQHLRQFSTNFTTQKLGNISTAAKTSRLFPTPAQFFRPSKTTNNTEFPTFELKKPRSYISSNTLSHPG